MSKESEFLEKAKAAGCCPHVTPNFIEWNPALPTPLLLACVVLNQEKLKKVILGKE